MFYFIFIKLTVVVYNKIIDIFYKKNPKTVDETEAQKEWVSVEKKYRRKKNTAAPQKGWMSGSAIFSR